MMKKGLLAISICISHHSNWNRDANNDVKN